MECVGGTLKDRPALAADHRSKGPLAERLEIAQILAKSVTLACYWLADFMLNKLQMKFHGRSRLLSTHQS
jgi:hypothetical protein